MFCCGISLVRGIELNPFVQIELTNKAICGVICCGTVDGIDLGGIAGYSYRGFRLGASNEPSFFA